MKIKLIPILIFFITFGVYVVTMVPTITGDDSGELAGVGATLGTAHPPGYPLYSLMSKMVVSLFPYGNYAYRVNLVSALTIALSALIFYFVILKLTRNIFVSTCIPLIYAFTNSVWSMANTTEVYGIATLFLSLICLAIIQQPSEKLMLFMSFLVGLAMTSHYTIGLLMPGILWWIFCQRKEFNLNKVNSAQNILFGIAGFSVVIYMLIRSKQQPLFDWEDPETLKRLWQVIARLRYGSLALAQGGMPPLAVSVIFKKIKFFAEVIISNFTVFGLLYFGYGLWNTFKDKKLGWTFILLLLGSGPGFLLMANVGIDNTTAALLKRFLFMSFMIIAVIIAKSTEKMPKALTLPLAAIPFMLVLNNFPQLNQRNQFYFYDHANNILKTTPKDTILLSDRADEMEFCIAYLHLAEGKRSDIEFVDCNAGVTKSIYGNDYYRIWGKPRLAIREKTEKEIIKNSKKNVYYATFHPDMVNIPRIQKGLLFDTNLSNKKDYRYDKIYLFRYPKSLVSVDKRSENTIMSYLFLVGKYFVGNDMIKLSENYFEGLSAFDPNGKSIYNIGFIYHEKGLDNLALKYYQRSISKGWLDATILLNMGTIFEKKGMYDQALAHYEKASIVAPNNEQVYYNKSVIYWHQQNWNKVIEQLNIVLKINPNHKQAKKYLYLAKQKI